MSNKICQHNILESVACLLGGVESIERERIWNFHCNILFNVLISINLLSKY